VERLDRDGVVLALERHGVGDPPLVLVHGVACHRGFWAPQIERFARDHLVVALDLRGHGDSDAPEQRYTMAGFADDVAWTCERLAVDRPVLIGHSLGGLVALAFAAAYPDRLRAAVLIDSVLLPDERRPDAVHELVAGLRGPEPESALRGYFLTFFGPSDSTERRDWILEQAARTPSHVTSSVWEESLLSWDDADALGRCHVPLLYLDAGTPNANLAQAKRLCRGLIVARTRGSGHFSQLEVPERVNAALERFLAGLGT
jgi:pimeloyl-ACP methyl ester carboxylesterase